MSHLRVWLHKRAFSLIEVVIATGIFAVAIVAVVGLMGPMTKHAEDVIDSEVAARLSASVQSELERIGFGAAVVFPASVVLFANPDGTTVRLWTSTTTPRPVDRALNDGELPGIAERDRYFLITLSQMTGPLSYSATTSGSLALRADIQWPYQIPTGPATSGNNVATGAGADQFTVVPETQRQRLAYFFALRP